MVHVYVFRYGHHEEGDRDHVSHHCGDGDEDDLFHLRNGHDLQVPLFHLLEGILDKSSNAQRNEVGAGDLSLAQASNQPEHQWREQKSYLQQILGFSLLVEFPC